MKKVLITGGSGFIGRHCLPALVASGYEVHAVSLIPEDPLPQIHWHVVDLLNPGEVNDIVSSVKPTHLLHLSWYMVVGKYWTSLENVRWVQASLELLRVFAANGGKRVVMAGTCAEYDWNYELCSEQTTPLVPSTLYGACKHALQIMVDAFCRQTGLSYAWGRIFFLYGPHEHPDRLVSSVIRALLQGEPARCSHGNQLRDFLHVEDVAHAFVALLDSNIEGAVNIGQGTPAAIREIVETIGEQLGAKHLIQLGALPSPPNEPPVLIADTRRLKSIGWQAKYDLKTGLEHTIAWWKNNLLTAKRPQQ